MLLRPYLILNSRNGSRTLEFDPNAGTPNPFCEIKMQSR